MTRPLDVVDDRVGYRQVATTRGRASRRILVGLDFNSEDPRFDGRLLSHYYDEDAADLRDDTGEDTSAEVLWVMFAQSTGLRNKKGCSNSSRSVGSPGVRGRTRELRGPRAGLCEQP